MSYSTIQSITLGVGHENIREFRNSHGTAPVVWGDFCVRYMHKDQYAWLLMASVDGRKFWDLWKDPTIPKSHRAVFTFLFDHFYVAKKNYLRFAADLRAYLDDTKISANCVNHWPMIAQMFEMEPDYPAMAIWCTSVTPDPWNGEFDEERDEYKPFDWSVAFEVYEELDEPGNAREEN